MYKFQRIKKKKKNLDLGTPILNMNSEEHKPKKKKMDENTILFLTFWGYSQFRS